MAQTYQADTLETFEHLQSAGFDADKARALLRLVPTHDMDEYATKKELYAVRDELKSDIAGVREELKSDIAGVREELKSDIAGVREELKTDIAGVRAEIAHLGNDLKWIKIFGGGIAAGIFFPLIGSASERLLMLLGAG